MAIYTRDGIWYADVSYIDENGKRQRVQRSTGTRNDGTRASQRIAEKKARDIEDALADGRGRRAKGVSLGHAYERRAAEQGLAGASDASIQITREKAAHVLDFFGDSRDVLMSPLTTDDLKTYAIEARRARAIATVTRELVELRCALRAVKAPVPELPELGKAKPKEIWLDAPASAALIEHLPESRKEHAIVYRLAGLRYSELYRLERKDIRGNLLRVRGTKTEGADRTVPMHPTVAEILAKRADVGVKLFPDVWLLGNGSRDLTEAARRAGLAWDGRPIGVRVPGARRGESPRVSFNVLRASFCTSLVLGGIPLKKIAYLMGHRNTHMVERVYTRFFGSDLDVDLAAALPALGGTDADV